YKRAYFSVHVLLLSWLRLLSAGTCCYHLDGYSDVRFFRCSPAERRECSDSRGSDSRTEIPLLLWQWEAIQALLWQNRAEIGAFARCLLTDTGPSFPEVFTDTKNVRRRHEEGKGRHFYRLDLPRHVRVAFRHLRSAMHGR